MTEKQWRTHLKQKAEGKRQPPKNQTCELCGERFPIKDALTRHLAHKHGFEKKEECKVCGKKFATPEHLAKHMVTHTRTRDFVCNTCGKAFGRVGNLRQHMVSHKPPKHECTVCGKMFLYRAAGLNTHLRQVHGVDPRGNVSPAVPEPVEAGYSVDTPPRLVEYF